MEDWLKEYLSDEEWHLADEVRIAYKKAGYQAAKCKKARIELGVETYHQFAEDGKDTGKYYWRLRK